MGCFARITQRVAKLVGAVGSTDTSTTTPSESGPTQSTQSQYLFAPIAMSARLDEPEGLAFRQGSGTGINLPSKAGEKPGRESRQTRLATLLSRSIGVFGIKGRSKKRRTGQPFLRELDLELWGAAQELKRSLTRQSWGDQCWSTTRRPSMIRRVRLAVHRKHKGEWTWNKQGESYYDCEECGQPVKETWGGYWSRYCDTCGKFERVDKIPVTRKRWFR